MSEPTVLARANADLEALTREHNEIRAKHSGTTLPAEAAARDGEIAERVKRLRVVIEEEQQKERDSLFNDTAEWMENPRYHVPKAVNPDEDGRRVLAQSGWEVKGGVVHRQTSLGEIAMMPEEVLFGSLTNEKPEVAKYFRQTRAIIQPEYRAAYTKWLRARYQGEGADDAAIRSLTGPELNALQEGQSDLGGFLVPPDMQAEMLVRMAQEAVMRRLCRVVPTARDKVQWPAVKKATSNGTIYSSGFVGSIAGETPAFSETDPGFEQFEVGVKKFRTATKMSNDWLDDALGNMLAWLAQNGAENLALVEDYYFINGDGTALQPTGILNSGLSTTDVEGTTSDHISNSVSNAGSAPKIDGLPFLVPAQYVGRASWLAARATEGKIRALVAADGRPWWMPAAQAGGAGSNPRDLGGYPIYNSDFMPVGGTNGNKVIVFGDFQQYVIAQRMAMSTIVLRERFAETEQTGIIINERAGGGLWNTDGLYIGIV